jgi:hypothetical protein
MAHPPGTARCDCGYSFRRDPTESRSIVMGVAIRNLVIGGLTLAAGLLVTGITIAFGAQLGVYIIAYGAVLTGGGVFLRGLVQMNRAKRVSPSRSG